MRFIFCMVCSADTFELDVFKPLFAWTLSVQTFSLLCGGVGVGRGVLSYH